MNTFKTAQYIIPNASSIVMAGFNTRIYGEKIPANYTNPSGFYKADDMILNGEIYFVNNFHKEECSGYAYQYGGFWVCDRCGKRGVDKYWWKIKVFKDGNEWCCIGENFINLQESENYSFGETREIAMQSYANKMILYNKEQQ